MKAIVQRTIIYCLIFLCYTSHSYAQDPEIIQGVVKILAINEFEEESIGAGIIVSTIPGQIYLVTAGHVVSKNGKPHDKIKVILSNSPDSLDAEIFQVDPVYDLAVIHAPRPNVPFEILCGTKVELNGNQRITIIGHPLGVNEDDFRILRNEKIDKPYLVEDKKKMTITNGQIKSGCSGGPIFDDDYNWVGMVISRNTIESECLKSDFISEYISEKWHTPNVPSICQPGIGPISVKEVFPQFAVIATGGAITTIGLIQAISARKDWNSIYPIAGTRSELENQYERQNSKFRNNQILASVGIATLVGGVLWLGQKTDFQLGRISFAVTTDSLEPFQGLSMNTINLSTSIVIK